MATPSRFPLTRKPSSPSGRGSSFGRVSRQVPEHHLMNLRSASKQVRDQDDRRDVRQDDGRPFGVAAVRKFSVVHVPSVVIWRADDTGL